MPLLVLSFLLDQWLARWPKQLKVIWVIQHGATQNDIARFSIHLYHCTGPWQRCNNPIQLPPKSYVLHSFLVLMFCCPFFGFVAMIYAFQVSDYDLYRYS